MFSAGPAVQPNSAENAFDSTAISWTAPTGTVASIVWRPHASSLLAPSSMNVVVRRLPDAGDEVRRVDEEVAGPLALPERRVEQRQRRDLAAENRRLVDRLAVEPAADLRIGAHALVGAEDGHFRLLRPTSSFTFTVAVSPARSASVLDAPPSVNPAFDTVTV